MKFQRFLGGMLLCLGGVCALVALIAMVLPMLDNEQIRLILRSLEVRTRSQVANGLNQAMLFILRHHDPLLGAGMGLALLGSLLLYNANRRPEQIYYEGPPSRSPYTVLDGKSPRDEQEPSQWRRPAYRSVLSVDPSDDFSNTDYIARRHPPPLDHPFDDPPRGRQEANPYRAYGQRAGSILGSERDPLPPPHPGSIPPPAKPFSWLDSIGIKDPAATGEATQPSPAASPEKTVVSGLEKSLTASPAQTISQLPYQRPQPAPAVEVQPAPFLKPSENPPKPEPVQELLKDPPVAKALADPPSLQPIAAKQAHSSDVPSIATPPVPPATGPGEGSAPPKASLRGDAPCPRELSPRIRSTIKRKTP